MDTTSTINGATCVPSSPFNPSGSGEFRPHDRRGEDFLRSIIIESTNAGAFRSPQILPNLNRM